jgi:hypothetical protein
LGKQSATNVPTRPATKRAARSTLSPPMILDPRLRGDDVEMKRSSALLGLLLSCPLPLHLKRAVAGRARAVGCLTEPVRRIVRGQRRSSGSLPGSPAKKRPGGERTRTMNYPKPKTTRPEACTRPGGEGVPADSPCFREIVTGPGSIYGRNLFLCSTHPFSEPFRRPNCPDQGEPMRCVAALILALLLSSAVMCTSDAQTLRLVVQKEDVIISQPKDQVPGIILPESFEDATVPSGGTMSIFWGEELLQADIPIRESFAPSGRF